ncbi:hypothetical protein C731_4320 [Mycolicibacterium hassiacum DSM 44199]|uniref:Uncharacterized protein n=1 Tax=Mycolicibacterium hassiacum (strain DSM 44199 / CIP 105218 / JCM 12690 / 3849) TaxID=1122247 RepID=K5BCN8_MYCHD|nr:hypothetical protein [Mycolicibacterium hassiacum]EKF21707.1 hypothetical protein C731_4320 [Mycolicibacterium hassiacum DSM 44199]MDA4088301.1 hypothetical protein [Mycolicibacterium hassiacum DSM 44199]VCT90582.1 hypothetical protein MHAS_02291 [Mycolicibacterium hassiacum DSM 44199]
MSREHHSDPDGRDPIRSAFDEYQRPPADIVPRHPKAAHSMADLNAVAGQALDVTHYAIDGDGVTQHRERVTVTHPILPKGTEQ